MGSTDNDSKQHPQEESLLGENVAESTIHDRHPYLHEALDHERELYLDLADALPLGIYRLRVFHDAAARADRWGSVDNAPYKMEFVNDRLFEILNVDKAAFLQNPGILNNYIIEEDRMEFIKRNVEANINTTPFVWEGRLTGNGRLLWVHFESTPRVLENKDVLWTGYFEDISEQKRASEELQQKNNELQLLNAEKDKFMSIIAHDMKSPFNSILGFSGILLEKLNQKDMDALREYCEIIRNSSQKAMNLLQNLMQWSQSQTGHMAFNPRNFDLSELIDEVIQLYENVAAQKSIQITKETPDTLTIVADKAMIGTVIRNLLSNAVKFSHKGGHIHIIACSIHNSATITVSDKGVGMPQVILEKIFHISSSHSLPDTNGEKGTGMGLLLCKEFIDKHNGTISVKSEQGKGSQFTVEIPLESH